MHALSLDANARQSIKYFLKGESLAASARERDLIARELDRLGVAYTVAPEEMTVGTVFVFRHPATGS